MALILLIQYGRAGQLCAILSADWAAQHSLPEAVRLVNERAQKLKAKTLGVPMLHRFAVACMAVTLFAGLSASRAKADSTNVVAPSLQDNFDFTIGANSYTWSITLPATVQNIDSRFDSFDVNAPYSLNGGTPTLAGLEFYDNPSSPGSFALAVPPGPAGTGVLLVTGPSLFTGSLTAPVFTLTDTTANTDLFTGAFTDLISGETGGTLTVTQTTVTATPEPGTLLLTAIGLIALFWMARKKKALSLAA